MGITIVSGGTRPVKKKGEPKKALILAGGALTGGMFKAGGLKALNQYFGNFSVSKFDIFVGVSSGSLLITPIAGGISPEEMIRSLDGHSDHFTPLLPWHFYYPNFREFMVRPMRYAWEGVSFLPKIAYRLLKDSSKSGFGKALSTVISRPSYSALSSLVEELTQSIESESFPHWMTLLPTGLFDNSTIERYLRLNIKKNKLTNNFVTMERLTGKRLYICAMTLDGAERVIFGPDEKADVTISESVQASTALPGFYKPARVRGLDYIDGGVLETAHIGVAIDKGAELVVCYNPFRPFDNHALSDYLKQSQKGKALAMGRLADQGFLAVLNQTVRTVYHQRLHSSIERYRHDKKFYGDIVLIEPKPTDFAFFEMNPLRFGHRAQAAVLGYESVRDSITRRYSELETVFARYGITMTRDIVESEWARLHAAGESDARLRAVLEGRESKARPKKSKKKTKS